MAETIFCVESAEPASPAIVTPMPACAMAAPSTATGKPRARRKLLATGARNSSVRSTTSAKLPRIIQVAAPNAKAGSIFMPIEQKPVTSKAANPAHQACSTTGQSLARFQGSSGPTAMAANSGMASGSTVALKNGAPTLIFCPSSKSAKGGYIVPTTTTAQIEHSRMLFSTNAPSREIGANTPPDANRGARSANSSSEPPITSPSNARIKMPRAGSLAKECTEFKMPERTRNVPDSDSENVPMASSTVQIFRLSRFSTTIAECTSAVPVSHGINDAFSTGSQNQ